MNRKYSMGIIAIAIIAGLLISSFAQFGAKATTYNADNMTVFGVLSTDTYVLYPYTAENLVWGFSKYGELINGAAKQGLEYNGMDVFANPNVLEKDWSQGWYIDIHYADLSNSYQHAWAYALYSDISGSSGIGGDWKENVQNGPLGTPYGGRKTNIWATTDPIKVLYDGPRSFVAQCRTTLYAASDHSVTSSGLVNVTITFVFNKDKKEIIEYKDIKRLDQGKFGRDFQVEFSNRGEWDIGTTSSPPSYAYFYHGMDTVYDYKYQPYYNSQHDANTYDVCQILDKSGTYAGFVAYWPSPFGDFVKPTSVITRTEVLSSLCTVEKNVTWSQINDYDSHTFYFGDQFWSTSDAFPIGGGVWSNEPMIFKNNVLLFSPSDYTWDSDSQKVTFTVNPASSDRFLIDYKHHQPDNAPSSYNMAYWGLEAGTPYVIGEWDFKLTAAPEAQQFRGVCVYGLTDRHDGDDADAQSEDWSYGRNNPDREIMYQLNEVFNPWDLNSAVEKYTQRWVEFYHVPVGGDSYTTNQQPALVVSDSEWDQYKVFSERVEDLNTSTVLNRYLGDYSFIANPGGTATFYGLLPGHYYKFLYSTYTYYESNFWNGAQAGYSHSNWWSNVISQQEINGTQNQNAVHTFTPSWGASWEDPTDVYHVVSAEELSFQFTNKSANAFTEDHTWTYQTPEIEWEHSAFIVSAETETNLESGAYSFAATNVTTVPNGQSSVMEFQLNGVELNWNIHPNDDRLDGIYFDNFCADYSVEMNLFYNATTMNYTLTTQLHFFSGMDELPAIYEYYLMGRYEEGVVGKNAGSVDSAGLSMISAAFKDKGVEYGIAAADMYDPAVANQMPYVMSKIGAGTSWSDYYYGPTDLRTALKDDWCTTWPISSANLIGSGGPLANMLAYYGNDFMTAFYGLNTPAQQFTPYAKWQNAIVPLSCWNASNTGYVNSADNKIGYAVVSTYMDINGTEMLLLWGNWGRDTYYIAKWFQEEGIYELQQAPYGITGLVVKITYKSTTDGYKPTAFAVVECLGTISETLWTGTLQVPPYSDFTKGGIHFDP